MHKQASLLMTGEIPLLAQVVHVYNTSTIVATMSACVVTYICLTS